MGGVEKRGGRKTSRMTPRPQRGFLDPPHTVRFPPPSGVVALFFLYKKSTTGQTISLTSRRNRKTQKFRNRRKIDKILFFANFSRIFPIFGLFSPIFRISGLFYSVAGQRDVNHKLFWRGPEFFGRARSLVRFPPPIHVLHPPHVMAQRNELNKWVSERFRA